ncbi:MAPEG family protein [Pseudomonas putida]|uniref:Microsomal glutathione S-transferase 1 n=1 Tax=Pseudomonas putida TaxID=303 RepID=A0A1Q9QUL6_PSEPU|nr:MAPEG family protein [Pseudomonas putida]OLS58829.1 hypothetical protein PSEMO_61900 [Pseudomonas putida]
MSALLSVYALCVVILFLKMLGISCYQGYYRISRLTFQNAEDARFVGRQASPEELPQVTRAARAWANDLENIPLFFVLGGLCVALDTAAGASLALFCVFTAARIAHTLCYLRQWQPWRTLAYAIALACLLGLAGMVVSRALALQ